MVKCIEKLTPEQEAKIPEFVEKWIKIGLCCEPADRRLAEDAYKRCYRLSDLDDDVPIFWVNSPMVGSLAASVADNIFDKRADEKLMNQIITFSNDVIREHLKGDEEVITLGNALKRIKSRTVAKTISAGCKNIKWHNWLGGQFWLWWIAKERFYTQECGLELEPKIAECAQANADTTAACYWWPNQNFIVACERPVEINRDEEGRLHAETHKAISWPDGWGLYMWHGIKIPKAWIEDPKSITPQVALKWENIEQRRVACEIVGWDNILRQLNAVTIDKDPEPEVGELVEVNIPDIGQERFLRVKCGTGRWFALPVPTDLDTALEANAWTYGVDKDLYKTLEHRT